MLIKLSPKRNCGVTLCVMVIIGILVIIIGGIIVRLLIKTCDACLKPKPPSTNEVNIVQFHLLPPPGAITIQQSSDLKNWSVKFYLTLTTNAGMVTLQTFNLDGKLQSTISFPTNAGNVTNEIWDTDLPAGSGFYEVR